MTCGFCNTPMDIDETDIMCMPCATGGHVLCYVTMKHGDCQRLNKQHHKQKAAAHHQHLSGKVTK